MIKVNKFEALGIGFSVAVMALALFLVRFDALNTNSDAKAVSQSASVINFTSDQTLANEALQGDLNSVLVNDIVLGNGVEVEKGDTVVVDYIGTLQNGQQFDNSYTKGTPFTFKVGDSKVIEGWNLGVIGMKEGGQRVIVIPSELAYGKEGYGPIPKNADLVFAVELREIK